MKIEWDLRLLFRAGKRYIQKVFGKSDTLSGLLFPELQISLKDFFDFALTLEEEAVLLGKEQQAHYRMHHSDKVMPGS